MPGRVFLVGAGPGAPGLLTLRGRALLAAADVVVYDALVSPALLRYARPEAERIDAGKRAGAHKLKQEEINSLLVERARLGLQVVRLKGGDPFIFGRGGEEAAALEKAAIPYEVVPGVSSAYAVPAYAGISLTQRGVSSSIHVFAAQSADPSSEPVPWPQAAGLNGTLVFLMGYERLGEIRQSLMAEGMAGSTPVAIVQWGATIHQRQVFCALADAEQAAHRAALGPPAVVVVGQAAAEDKRFKWTEYVPLFGKTIGFTREARRATPWLETFEGLGARVLDYPLVRTAPIDPGPESQRILDGLADFDWIVFTNSFGVEAFFEWLSRRRLDARFLAGRQIAAVGPQTANALAAHGICADLVSREMSQEGLARELPLRKAMKVLLPGSPRSRDTLKRAVENRGGQAVRLALYDTLSDKSAHASLVEALEAGQLDFLVVLTPLAAQVLTEGRCAAEIHSLFAKTRLVSLGPQAAQVFHSAGRPPDLTLGEPTLEALIEALSAARKEG